MERFLDDLRVAFRAMLVRPAFTLAAVLTLALGIGSTTTVFSVVFAVLLRPLPFPEPARLVTVWQTAVANPVPPEDGVSSPESVHDWRRARSLEAVALHGNTNVVLNDAGEPELIPAATVSTDFFRTLGRRLTLGREFTADEARTNGPLAAIISHGMWLERFGGASDVIGRTIVLSGRPRTIVGVAPAQFDFPRRARLWLPLQNDPASCGRGCVYMNGVARLRPDVALPVAEQELAAIARDIEREAPGTNTGVTFKAASLHQTMVGEVKRPLYILLAAIFMVLLIACVNVANLLLGRGSARSGEIAVRFALGATRARLVRLLLTESVVLALAGGVLGAFFAYWALDAVIALSPGDLPRLDEVNVGAAPLLFTGAITMLTALLFGLAPAFRLTGMSLATSIRAGGRGATAGRRAAGRSLLLAGEVGFSVVLLLAAGLLVRSFLQIQAVPLGFDPVGVAQFTVVLPGVRYDTPDRAVQFFAELRDRVRRLPGVEEVSSALAPPLGASLYASSFERVDRPPPEPGQRTSIVLRTADPSYTRVLGIPLLSGRTFQDSDRHGAAQVALITRAAAERYWRGENPIGKQIRVGVNFGYANADAITIVGVIGDLRGTGLTTQPAPELFLAQAQAGSGSATMLIRTRGDASQVLSLARAELRAMDAALPMVRAGAMTDFVEQRMAAPRFYMTLLTGFALIAVLLAAIGIYGVVAYLVAQRTREIGVRMALGARLSNVVTLVVWQGLRPALLGIAVGLGTALAVGTVLQSLLFQVGARDPLTFAGVPVLVVAIVLLACLLPARRAARTSPAIALRSENR